MNNREMITQISRRLPQFRKRDVADLLEVLTELWAVELSKPEGNIHLTGLGRLYTECHRLKATGAILAKLVKRDGTAAPSFIVRRVIRFRPSDTLRAMLKQGVDTNE